MSSDDPAVSKRRRRRRAIRDKKTANGKYRGRPFRGAIADESRDMPRKRRLTKIQYLPTAELIAGLRRMSIELAEAKQKKKFVLSQVDDALAGRDLQRAIWRIEKAIQRRRALLARLTA